MSRADRLAKVPEPRVSVRIGEFSFKALEGEDGSGSEHVRAGLARAVRLYLSDPDSNRPGRAVATGRGSALMEPDASGRIGLLLTGSLREKLDLMLHTDTEPIWDQTHDVDLPPIDAGPFAAFLEHAFEATGKPIDGRAADLMVELTDAHPKRTQHLAWQTWEAAEAGQLIDANAVQAAFDQLLSTHSHSTDFGAVIDGLLAGEDSDGNDAKALFLVASGASPGSRTAPPRYGLSGPDTAKRALERLRARGIVEGAGSSWRILDPLFAEWLRRNDPLGMERIEES